MFSSLRAVLAFSDPPQEARPSEGAPPITDEVADDKRAIGRSIRCSVLGSLSRAVKALWKLSRPPQDDYIDRLAALHPKAPTQPHAPFKPPTPPLPTKSSLKRAPPVALELLLAQAASPTKCGQLSPATAPAATDSAT